MRVTSKKPVWLLASVFVGLALSCGAQINTRNTPRFDLGLGYSYVHANAPAGGCGCFSMNGGNVSGAYHPTRSLALAAEFQGAHAGQILGSTESLNLYTYLFGARFAPERFRKRHAIFFGEAMVGGAHTTSQYPYSDGGSGIAFLAGGGLDVPLSRHIALRPADVDYLYTHIPNGTNNFQNNLRVSAGIVFHLR